MSWKSTRKLNWACIAFTVSVLACTVLIVLCAFEKREGMCCLCTVGAGFSSSALLPRWADLEETLHSDLLRGGNKPPSSVTPGGPNASPLEQKEPRQETRRGSLF